MNKKFVRLAAMMVMSFSVSPLAFGQSTAFTYQGKLNDNGSPANGIYDLRFAVYDAVTNGLSQGVVTNAPTTVSNGLFTVQLDFGSGVFNGAARWLEIGVRTNGDVGVYSSLSPRRQVTSAPYAIQASNAVAALTASNAITANSAGQLTGTLSASNISNGLIASNMLATGAVGSNQLAAGAVINSVLANGAVTAAKISGILLTNQIPDLDAVKIISGTLNDAQLSTNVARLNTNQTFTGSNAFTGVVSATNGNSQFVGTFTGNGAGLTNINGTNIASGTINDARLSANIARLNANQTFTGSNNISGSFSGNGGGLTNLNAAQLTGSLSVATLPAVVVTNGSSTVNLSGTFTGNGGTLTNIALTAIGQPGLLSYVTNYLTTTLALGRGANSVAVADVNNDGKQDLITANNNYSISVLTNNGAGIFALATNFTPATGGMYVGAGDVNGDGKPDLAIGVGGGDNDIFIYTNNGSGVFVSNATYHLFASPGCVALVDVNGNGKSAFVAGCSGNVFVYTNNGSGLFGQQSVFSSGSDWRQIVPSDVTGDGMIDFVAVNFYGSVQTFINNSSGAFYMAASSTSVGGGHGAYGAAIADVNGNGLKDLVVAAGSAISVMYLSGFGVFTVQTNIPISADARSLTLADVNGDGKPDVIYADSGGNKMVVTTNDGTGYFVTSSTVTVGSNSSFIVPSDFNGDGKPDFAVANNSSLTELIYAEQITSSAAVAFTNLSTIIAGSLSGTFSGNASGTFTGTSSGTFNGTSSGTFSGNASGTFSGTGSGTFNGNFSGDGGSLTNLNASNLVTGTVADARLSGNVALLSGTQTFTGAKTFSAAGNSFTGNGAGLTSLNASNLSSGTIADVRLSTNAALRDATQTFTGVNTFSAAGNSFTGNGSGLTSLNASNLTSGTVADARLSTNAALRSGGNTFVGNQTISSGNLTVSGSLGVGTTSPNKVLEVSVPSGNGVRITGPGGSGATVALDLATYNPTQFSASTPSARIQATDNNFSGDLDFQTKTSGAATNGMVSRLFIANGGNVGIGTNAPQSKLQVIGDVALGSSGQYFAPAAEENLRIIRGSVSAAGALVVGSGFTPSRTANATYSITFSTAFSSIPSVVASVGAAGQTPSSQDAATVISVTTTNFTLQTGVRNIGFFDEPFSFIALGPR